MSTLRSILAVSAVALATFLGLVAPAAQAVPRPDPVREQASSIMAKDYNSFLAIKRSLPAPFDWRSDGCTPPTPRSWANLFDRPCQLHDFGYRNYGGHGLRLSANESTRDFVDGRFLAEMRRLCHDTFNRWWQSANKATCRVEADTIWSAVRHGGRNAFYNG